MKFIIHTKEVTILWNVTISPSSAPARQDFPLQLRQPIRKKKILLVGSRDLSSKVQKAQEIQNYLGFPDISGAELGKAFEEHIDRMQVPIVEERVNLIYPMGDYFSLQVGQEICEADAVILATGVNFGKPLPGEEEFLGRVSATVPPVMRLFTAELPWR